MASDLLRYRNSGQTISFGDINEALGLQRATLRTLKGVHDSSYNGSLPNVNRFLPKVSYWYNYYRPTAWRGINVTCLIADIPSTPGAPVYLFNDSFTGDDDSLTWLQSTSDFSSISLYEINITQVGNFNVFTGTFDLTLVKTLYTNTADSLYWQPDSASGNNRVVAFNHNSIARLYGTGNYTLKVRAKDALGQYSSYSTDSSIYSWNSQTQAAYPTSLSATSITNTSFNLNWVASTYLGNGVTGYQIFKNGVYFSTVGLVTSTTITGLASGTIYEFTIFALIGTMLSPSSDILTVTTTAVVSDTTKPSTLAKVIMSNKVSDGFSVSWVSATDNIGVVGYYIQLNGYYETTVASDVLQYDFTGLAANTSYTVGVAAYDAAGNVAIYRTVTGLTTALVVCLIEGTLITLHDGTQVPIETLQVNDSLLSLAIHGLPLYSDDETVLNTWSSSLITGSIEVANVVAIQPVLVDSVININSGLIISTPEHRHLIKTDNIWSFKKNIDVVIGDTMLDINNNEIVINSIETQNSSVTVYKLDVENLDIFYANNILTHNVKAPI